MELNIYIDNFQKILLGCISVSKHFYEILSEAPGRITLFGEHQDYLGLPVISGAIDRKITIKGKPISEKRLVVNLRDLGITAEYEINKILEYEKSREYIKSGINVFLKSGYKLDTGYSADIKGDIPISSGLSSSSALVVAWVNFLFATQNVHLNPLDLALTAFRAEVEEFNEPGGNQDHITSSFGGVVYIEQGDKPKVQQLQIPQGTFIIVNSGIPKPTLKTLSRIKTEVKTALDFLSKVGHKIDLRKISVEEVKKIAKTVPYFQTLIGIVLIRDLTYRAVEELSKGTFDDSSFGRLLTEHHNILRDYLRVSHPILDKIITKGLEEGALGGKLVGSGEGGCVLLYVTNTSKIQQILQKIRKELKLNAFSTRISDGANARIINEHEV